MRHPETIKATVREQAERVLAELIVEACASSAPVEVVMQQSPKPIGVRERLHVEPRQLLGRRSRLPLLPKYQLRFKREHADIRDGG